MVIPLGMSTCGEESVACGGSYAALVTKQGEIFSWGVEVGGRLGYGVHSDSLQPKLIDSFKNTNVKLVACGEYHTCAVSLSGDLYTWGDGIQNHGLLGHGNQLSYWIPKRVRGPPDSVPISYISCGPWHTAVVTSSGQLFTFGALGHGDRLSVRQPREVVSLKGIRTVRASCGVWHTAAVVEVLTENSGSSNTSGKLFTWGDGDTGTTKQNLCPPVFLLLLMRIFVKLHVDTVSQLYAQIPANCTLWGVLYMGNLEIHEEWDAPNTCRRKTF